MAWASWRHTCWGLKKFDTEKHEKITWLPCSLCLTSKQVPLKKLKEVASTLDIALFVCAPIFNFFRVVVSFFHTLYKYGFRSSRQDHDHRSECRSHSHEREPVRPPICSQYPQKKRANEHRCAHPHARRRWGHDLGVVKETTVTRR